MDLSARNLSVLGRSSEAALGGVLDAAPDAIVVAEQLQHTAHVAGVLCKPFGLEDLWAAVEHALHLT